uniref:EOG090X04Z9 n=1 Tax=Scapholeberis mucronata TaxID=202097 RepID=A0A4Y7NK24_9CRUS|nr:EOG090X04Z9 [Scapholeberis mucronata]SVE93581.1 EOG090X04Z9 [Scapholeberis mucronata]
MPLNTVERYDPRQNKWTLVAPMSTRRKHLGCAVYNNWIYAVGGRDDATELSSAERYNPHTNSWSPIVAMSSRRSGVGLAVVNGQLYAVGGFDGSTYLKTIEVYDPEQNQWRLCGTMNYRRLGGGFSARVSTTPKVIHPIWYPVLGVSHLLFLDASPPGFVSLEEIMKAANSVSKMALAHDIAVDDDFQLEKVNLPTGSIQKTIKDIAHQAFWDLLKEEFEQDPPKYERALTLLEEIKEWLLSLLLPHQTRTQQEIKDKLDTDLIRQQIEAETLDLHSYSQYIISLMARLCAPGRDDKIRELTATKDLVLLYKGIFETLELMRIDMANFTIRMSRPHIAACSVEYERAKFEDYLKITPDGLRNTREWLKRNRKEPVTDSQASANGAVDIKVISSVLVDSFMELLNWDENYAWPETLAVDEQRFKDLRHKLKSVQILSSVLLLSLNRDLGLQQQTSPEFRGSLKEHAAVILGDARSLAELEAALPNVAAQVLEDINKALKDQGSPELATETKSLITAEILAIRDPENRVMGIVYSRLMEFLKQVISNEVARPTQIPSGLSLFKTEIAAIAGRERKARKLGILSKNCCSCSI